MSYDIIDEALRIHVENDYFVCITPTDSKMKLEVTYPGNVLKMPNILPLVIDYDIEIPGIITKLGSDGSQASFEVPEYATRIIVIADIIIECQLRNLNINLFYDNELNELDFFSIKEMMIRPKDTEKEGILENLLIDILNSEHDMENAEIKSVELGYDKLCQVISFGGI